MAIALPQIDPVRLAQYGTTGNTGVVGPGTLGSLGGGGSLAGMTPEQQYWAAVQGLGWDRNNAGQYRGQQQQLVDYLAAHGAPGWQSGGMQADDWLKDPSGGEWDMNTAGGQLVFNPDYTNTGGGPQGAVTGQQGGGSLIDDPGYQFRMGEGLKALQRSAAARGTLLTGGTLKGLQRYAQDYASGEYQNAFNRNMGVADLGLRAAGGLVGAGSNFGREAGDLYSSIGNAQGAGTMGRSNAWQGALGDLTNMASDYWLGRNSGFNI